MKRTRILAYMLNLYSMSAVASYECTLKLAHSEDLNMTIAEKVLTIGRGEMKSGNMGTLYVEFEKKKKTISLDINAVMSGWQNEEDATFVILRRTKTRRNTSAETISEIMGLKGDDQRTGWFDSYKLDINCRTTQASL
jgi:hypothetical protein